MYVYVCICDLLYFKTILNLNPGWCYIMNNTAHKPMLRRYGYGHIIIVIKLYTHLSAAHLEVNSLHTYRNQREYVYQPDAVMIMSTAVNTVSIQ